MRERAALAEKIGLEGLALPELDPSDYEHKPRTAATAASVEEGGGSSVDGEGESKEQNMDASSGRNHPASSRSAQSTGSTPRSQGSDGSDDSFIPPGIWMKFDNPPYPRKNRAFPPDEVATFWFDFANLKAVEELPLDCTPLPRFLTTSIAAFGGSRPRSSQHPAVVPPRAPGSRASARSRASNAANGSTMSLYLVRSPSYAGFEVFSFFFWSCFP